MFEERFLLIVLITIFGIVKVISALGRPLEIGRSQHVAIHTDQIDFFH